MRVLIDIGHPADVHLFKHLAWNLIKGGHQVRFTAKDKEVVPQLLGAYGFDYVALGEITGRLHRKVVQTAVYGLKLLRIAWQFKPDIFVSMVSPCAGVVSKILRRPSIAFEDTESATFVHRIGIPFVDTVVTPLSFRKNFGSKQVRYDGYHELAYLHPSYFAPDPLIADELDLTESEKLIVIRFVSWGAMHDRKQHGFTDRKAVIKTLERYGRVLVSSESELEADLQQYRMSVAPQHIHTVLHCASLYIGEGATMATEAALLGTPALYVSTLCETIGHYGELEREYGLLYSFKNQESALEKAADLLVQDDIKGQWSEKRERLIRDKMDVTAFMTELVEGYPGSLVECRERCRNSPTV